jgi:hypothetical protein
VPGWQPEGPDRKRRGRASIVPGPARLHTGDIDGADGPRWDEARRVALDRQHTDPTARRDSRLPPGQVGGTNRGLWFDRLGREMRAMPNRRGGGPGGGGGGGAPPPARARPGRPRCSTRTCAWPVMSTLPLTARPPTPRSSTSRNRACWDQADARWGRGAATAAFRHAGWRAEAPRCWRRPRPGPRPTLTDGGWRLHVALDSGNRHGPRAPTAGGGRGGRRRHRAEARNALLRQGDSPTRTAGRRWARHLLQPADSTARSSAPPPTGRRPPRLAVGGRVRWRASDERHFLASCATS